MPAPNPAHGDIRILIYSHDSYGLGHLRRCRTIAEALVGHIKNASVLIVSGSEVAGSFHDIPGIDVIKIPGVVKQDDGTYASRANGVAIEKTLALRQAIISDTTQAFAPHIFIVDKEPMGLLGEVENTLIEVQLAGGKTVLGLRDVMDSPEILKAEWERKDLISKTASLFDEIWIYGPSQFWNPLNGLDVPPHMEAKMHHVGFINRHREPLSRDLPFHVPDHFLLATAGGGGDGDDIMLQILAAHERFDDLPPMILLTGPLMPPVVRATIHARASALNDITVVDFVPEPEVLMQKAQAVIGMCGYNTFCEILSYDKPALYLPRTSPRMEQWVRANRAAQLGLASLIESQDAADPSKMADALRTLAQAPKPSTNAQLFDMAGLENLTKRVVHMLADQQQSETS